MLSPLSFANTLSYKTRIVNRGLILVRMTTHCGFWLFREVGTLVHLNLPQMSSITLAFFRLQDKE